MAMDRIHNLNQIVEVVRKQVADAKGRAAGAPRTRKRGQTEAALRHEAPSELRDKVAERIRHVDPKQPGAHQRAVRVLLESILSWELGDHLLLDPRFSELVNELETVVNADDELKSKFERLLTELRSGQ